MASDGNTVVLNDYTLSTYCDIYTVLQGISKITMVWYGMVLPESIVLPLYLCLTMVLNGYAIKIP